MTFTAGNKGPDIRSDCWISLTLKNSGGIAIHLDSKVKVLYGQSIEELCKSVLIFFEIMHADVVIEDKGALDFVIAARLESVIRQAVQTNKQYLPAMIPENLKTSSKNQNRFSRLYIPGNAPKLMINAGIYGSGGVILDLEDSVAADKKIEARILVRNALRSIDFNSSERMVRINQLPMGLDDLTMIIPQNPNLILIPKCESADQIKQVDSIINDLLPIPETTVYLMPIIESALGVINAYSIASASPRIVGLAIGLEDYTADIGVQRTNQARESFYARSAIVNAARAAGVQPIDSVFSDVGDMEALEATVKESKSLGFVGMGCIHPRQVPIINENFSPDSIEIEKAKRIVLAFDVAQKQGLGVVSLGSKMIDAPVVERAQNTIKLAIETGKLSNNWRSENEA
jgi:citrate lyase subunit beta / citryl-CoA lyase